MRKLRTLLLTLAAVGLLASTSYAVPLAAEHLDVAELVAGEGETRAAGTGEQDGDGTGETGEPEPRTAATLAPKSDPIRPDRLLGPGDEGMKVRELQHRLFQLAWFPERTTGTYDAATKEAVTGFQDKRGVEADGVVDRATWRNLLQMSEQPTQDQMRNNWKPGPTLLGPGASGEEVRDLQARLVQTAWLDEVTGDYTLDTTAAVRGFQEKRRIPVTGEVDERTRDRLVAMTHEPSWAELHPEEAAEQAAEQAEAAGAGHLDPRCLTGRALCIDKTTNSLSWVVDGQVLQTVDVRFGSDELPTREGAFSVFHKSRDHVSSLYDTSMPFALFFSGGQAVHFSPDFAANGYSGASHGCVNVRDYDAMAGLFDQVQHGDKVIVHRS